MKKQTKNNISLDGQLIEINRRKYALMEMKNDSYSFTILPPLFSLEVDVTKTKLKSNFHLNEKTD